MQKSATTFSSYILLQQHILNVIRLTGQGYNCTFSSSPVIYNWIVSRLLVLPLSLLTVTLLNCWKICDWLVIFLRSIQRSWIRLKHETTASDLELMMVLAGWLDGAHDHNDKNDKRPETSKPWSGFVHYIPSQCHKWIISFSSRSTMTTMMIWLGSWSVYGRDKKKHWMDHFFHLSRRVPCSLDQQWVHWDIPRKCDTSTVYLSSCARCWCWS